MSEEPRIVDHASEIHSDQIAGLRQTARERRMAWARHRLVPAPVDWTPYPRVIAAPHDKTPLAQLPRRGWSLNVEVIDRERLLRGWTQRELARQAGVDQGTLSDLLAGRRRPTLGTVQAICTSLRLTLAQVIAFDAGDE
jgi:DNA-binding XRE family transcriptional regulator